MDRTVTHLNIEHYRKLLTQELTNTPTSRLLAEEEAKLASLSNPPRQKASP